MVEDILPDIYRITLPLPRNPLREINTYVILGEDRNLFVDTGMNRPECREVLDEGIEELGIDLSVTDVFVTHLHADHLGNAPRISGGKTNVYMGGPDIESIEETTYWSSMLEYAVMNGFPNEDPEQAIKRHPGYRYGPLGPMKMVEVREGDRFDVGRYSFEAVFTPGHSKGHMCLYEREKKILFSGDHLLDDITPNISLWEEGEDPLSDYLRSLGKVMKMDVDMVLPGHRRLIEDHRRRIDDLIRHHEERADEVEDILKDGELTAFDTAAKMTWDMTYDSFHDFPIMQKWFALGEAIAHLRYLDTQGRIKYGIGNGLIRYSLM
ncbi:MAG: MBL fold metallo-hydrolase [Thermoplasmatota archaeon]